MFHERDPFAAYNLLSAAFDPTCRLKYGAINSSTVKFNSTSKLLSQAKAKRCFHDRKRCVTTRHLGRSVELVRETDGWRIQTLRNLKSRRAVAVKGALPSTQ
jgi:hypothetical protein